MTTEAPAQLLRLSDAGVSQDGTAVFFTVETTSGSGRLYAPANDIGNLLQFFGSLAAVIGNRPAASGVPQWPPINDVAPIPVTGIGFQAGSTPDKTLLVLNISGFALAAELPSNELASMAEQLANIARTLSASGGKN